jgi:hypothetical protein
VGPPVALCLLAALRLSGRPRSAAWAFVFGLSAAVVGALKLLYLALPAAFALLAALALVRGRTRPSLCSGVSVLSGFLVVWIPIVLYFVLHGATAELWWTTFGYPREALAEAMAAPPDRLRSSALWVARVALPWCPLIALGLTSLGAGRRRPLATGALAYLVVGGFLIVAQRLSWWEYHMVLLLPPLGLLAALGLDRLGEWLRSSRPHWPIPAAVALVLLWPGAELCQATWRKALALKAAAGERIDAPLAVRMDRRYVAIWKGTRFLRQGSQAGSIYVFGDPRILLVSGRRQAIPVRGHAWEHLPLRMWQELPGQLLAARPAFIFVSPYDDKVLRDRAPALREALKAGYRPSRGPLNGVWWTRRRASTDVAEDGAGGA